jgi:squalene-associated FAD-dependent desaturase
MTLPPVPQSPSPAARVAIVGGGLAGLAAAVALAEAGLARAGVAVDLYESRRRLAGRAGSFLDPDSGQWIDHCQHVSMGCCTNLADFCRRTGLAGLFRRDRVLHFFAPDGRRYDLAASPLPAPLHLAASFMRLGYLRLADRVSIARALWRLARLKPREADGQSIGPWLVRQGQSPDSIERFWAPVLVSALGECLERSSLKLARKVFVDGFMTNPRGYEIEVPRVALGELYGTRLETWLTERGVQLHLSTAIKRLSGTSERVTHLVLADERRVAVDAAVVAVTWRRVGEVLEGPLRAAVPNIDRFDQIEGAPITGVHLWFDRPITPLPHAVLVGTLAQWVFHRSDSGDVSRPGEYYYQVVISASRTLAGADRQATIDQILAELHTAFPAGREAKLLRWRIVTEPSAVFSAGPEIEPLRPPQKTAIGSLALAGDWTQTGWPATMEGAVRSGYLAAEAILAHFGRPARLLVEDLPIGRLARWLQRVDR